MHPSNEVSPTRVGGSITLPRAHVIAVIVCWLFVVFDGYDLIVYGNVISSLQDEWGISASTAGTLGSLAFVGMMIGAVLAGRLSDAIGRKKQSSAAWSFSPSSPPSVRWHRDRSPSACCV